MLESSSSTTSSSLPSASRLESTLTTLLLNAGIKIGGHQPWDIEIKDQRFFERVWSEGSLGLGEAYMQGWWECQALDQLVYKGLQFDLNHHIEANVGTLLQALWSRLINLQSPTRSRQVIEKHYDLDADFFMSFLDPYNQYTCGYFKDCQDLNQAQEQKLDLICKKLNLTSADHVLDIGCGWGGFSKFAASRYGCKVTGISISDEQIKYAREFCKGLPVEVKKCDYRDLKGTFSKVLVCGMLEHVGPKNYRRIAEIIHSVLTKDGIFLLHTIGGNKPQKKADAWLDKYIFPNYMIPAVPQLGEAFSGLFSVEDWHNFGPYYDPTLMAWNKNFEKSWPKLEARYDAAFRRMWNYYFLCCAGYFRARRSQLWQIVLTKVGRPQPPSRIS